MLTPACSVFKIVNFSFRLSTTPLGDFQQQQGEGSLGARTTLHKKSTLATQQEEEPEAESPSSKGSFTACSTAKMQGIQPEIA
jgi:hypothetical protein